MEPIARHRLDGHKSAGLLKNAVDRGQPESGAFAWPFGREERFEQMPDDVGRHSRAGVAHRQLQKVSRLVRRMQPAVVLVERSTPGFDRDASATRHRVSGVETQIDDDLLDLAAIDLREGQRRGQHRRERDVLADETPQHRAGVLNDRVHVHRMRLEDRLASEEEQLSGEERRTLACVVNLRRCLEHRV